MDLVSAEQELAGRDQRAVDGEALFAALQAGYASLYARVAEVNSLNVFPVPDGDTGTNMSLTLRAALDEVGNATEPSASEVMRKVAHGALMGARGNSGVILSQILRGVARGLDAKAVATADDIAAALKSGVDTAYKGVMKPVEGTMLTVIRDTAERAGRAVRETSDVHVLMDATLQEARASLARTPDLLPVLAEAGVVDAGGQGLLCIFEGILAFARGEVLVVERLAVPAGEGLAAYAQAPEEEQYGFDVQCIIQGEALDVEALRERIGSMGDSVLVVGDSRAVKVHVHSDHPGEVLEFAIQHGEVSSIIIENMQVQYREFVRASQTAGHQAAAAPVPVILPSDRIRAYLSSTGPVAKISVVAVVSGDGLSQVFESLGADAIVPGGQTMNPSTQDLLEAVQAVANDEVIILPNNSNIILTAEQARALSSRQVRVVPSRTVPQGISALLAFNYQAGLDENYETMAAASQQVETIEITNAVRSVQVNGVSVHEGQYIGLVNDDLKIAGDEIVTVVKALLDTLSLDEYEILTIYCGQDVSLEQGQALGDELGELYPDLEIEVLNGGQAHYHYIISAE